MDRFQIFIQQLLKSAIVGLSGICADFFITWMLKDKLRSNKYDAKAAGFSAAVANNFFLTMYGHLKARSQAYQLLSDYFLLSH